MQADQADWIEDAAHSAMDDCEHTPMYLVGSLVAGCLALGFSGNWLVGGGVAAAGIYWAEKRQITTLANARYAIDYGAAPVALKGEKALREYSDSMGVKATAEQLLQAARSNVKLDRSALDFLEEYYGDELDELLDKPLSEQQVQRFHLLKPILLDPKGATATVQAGGPPPQTIQELLERLKAECPDLLKLVKAPPIRLVGAQRTGKSTFGRKLALLRCALIPGHTAGWATPHREKDNLVPPKLNPFGTTEEGAKDMPAIESVWVAVQGAIDQGKELNTTFAWDEFGCYDQFRDKEVLGTSLKSLLRESSKHGYYPLLIAHGDQASFYPGVKNILTTLQQSTVKVETLGQQIDEFGTMRPTGEVEITWLDGTKAKFKVPEWLTVDLLLKFQPENTLPPLLNVLQPPPAPTALQSQKTEIQGPAVTQLQDQGLLYSPTVVQEEPKTGATTAIASPPPPPSNVVQFPQQPPPDSPLKLAVKELVAKVNALPPELSKQAQELKPKFQELIRDRRDDLIWLVSLSVERGEIKAADASRNLKYKPWFKELEASGTNTSEAIRGKFSELSDRGIGDCFGEGNKLTYLLFSGDERTLTVDPVETLEGVEDSEENSFSGV